MTSHQNILQVLLNISIGLSSNQACSVTSRKTNKQTNKKKKTQNQPQNKVPELLLLTARPEKTVFFKRVWRCLLPVKHSKIHNPVFSTAERLQLWLQSLTCPTLTKSDLDAKQKSSRETMSCLKFCQLQNVASFCLCSLKQTLFFSKTLHRVARDKTLTSKIKTHYPLMKPMASKAGIFKFGQQFGRDA